MAKRQPALVHHKASGQGRVRINGRDHYCGPYGSRQCKAEYDRLIRGWRLRQKTCGVTIGQLLLAWDEHAVRHYRYADGTPTSEVAAFKAALAPLAARYAKSQAADFGPRDLKRCRQDHVDAGLTRPTVNAYVRKIIATFKWATSEELVPVEVHTALRTVAGLRAGRTEAPEPPGVRPVALDDVRAVYDHVSRQVRAMIDLQLLSGCRPGEIVLLRPCDLEAVDECLVYRPVRHKNQHRGKSRSIVFGPRAVKILRPWLDDRPATAFCFSPAEAEAERLATMRENRQSPVQPSQRNRSKGMRQYGEHFTSNSYGRAIRRACLAAGIEPWAPNRIRHARATDLRKLFGIEKASHVLGHARLNMTEHYAEKSISEAIAVMSEIG